MALLGSVPTIGSILQLQLDQIWSDPASVFLKRYVEGIAHDLYRLEQEAIVDLSQVLQRPETRPLLVRAFEAAARSLGERKLEALRAATVQGIFERRYSFDMSVMVFSLLDRITDRHIQMLLFVREQQKLGTGGPGLSMLRMLDVEASADRSGFLNPVPHILDGQYVDQAMVDVNMLVAMDLENMGLIEADPDAAEAAAMDWSREDRQLRVLTMKGKLFYEHIVPAAPDLV